MILNYLKIAIRNLKRQKFYSVLNIFGLALGITCCILIFLYVDVELSYDKDTHNAENIYRLCIKNNIGGKIDKYCNAPRPTSPQMRAIYPEIETSTRVVGYNGLYTHSGEFSYQDRMVSCDKIYCVDSTFIDVFDLEIIQGNAEELLRREMNIIISESMAKRLFGNEDPLDKIVRVDDIYDVAIGGVFRDQPGRSHFEYEVLAPWLAAYRNGEEGAWYGWHVYHYLKLVDGADPEALEAKFTTFFDEYMQEYYNRLDGNAELSLQPLTKIHLTSDLTWEMNPNGNINNIYILSLVGIFLLIIACINYVNLATARSLRRSREVGLRKVFGSDRQNIVWQFLMESIILTLIATMIALVLAELLLPVFNNVTGLAVETGALINLEIIISLAITGIAVGFIAGIYPAFVMSNFKPIESLKQQRGSSRGLILRKILIVMQFAISIALIISTLILVQQMNFARTMDPGFNKENVVAITIRDSLIEKNIPQIKERLIEHTDIVSAACSFNLPGTTFNRFPAVFKDDNGIDTRMSCQFMQVDYDYLKTMEMDIAMGRNYDREHDSHWLQNILVNETAVERFGWDDPIGKQILGRETNEEQRRYLQVVGVVKDFYPNSVKQKISPTLIYLINDHMEYRYQENLRLFVRLKGDNTGQTLNDIREVLAEFNDDDAFSYVFLDEQLDKLYKSEDRLIVLFTYFTVVLIFIACLGLFGLAAYTAARRRKEIGIRKVLGASLSQIVLLLSKEFSGWVLLSNVLAWIPAWYFMNIWLQNFAYRIDINIISFIAAGMAAFAIAIITVSFQAIKAGATNPATTLRYE